MVARVIIGVSDRERERPQDILINITIFADLRKPDTSDDIQDCIDYGLLAKKIINYAKKSRRYTVEALAGDLANLCLEDARIEKVIVRVEKRHAVRFTKSVGVEIERSRESGAL